MPTKTKNPVTALLRKLRPMLPGKAVKKDATTYIVDGKVEVSLNYYCPWKMDPKDRGVCIPNSIIVRLADLDADKYGSICYMKRGVIFKSRTFNKRKSDDSFNLEGISAAVTKCIKSVDEILAIKKAEAKKSKELTERTLKERSKLTAAVKNLDFHVTGFNVNHLSVKDVLLGDNFDVTIYPDRDKDLVKFDIRLDELNLAQAIEVLSMFSKTKQKKIKALNNG